jgi:hypothetical protein
MEPVFNYSIDEFSNKVEATGVENAFILLQSSIGIELKEQDFNELELKHVVNYPETISSTNTISSQPEEASNLVTESVISPIDNDSTSESTFTTSNASDSYQYQTRPQIQGWITSFLYDFILVIGNDNVADYSLIKSVHTLTSYTMKPQKDNFTKFMNIKEYSKKPVYYFYDGVTNQSESLWWIFEYPDSEETIPGDILKPKCLPSDAAKIFNKARMYAMKRYILIYIIFFIKKSFCRVVEEGNLRQQVWSVDVDGDVETNFFRAGGINFTRLDLGLYGRHLHHKIINPAFVMEHPIFHNAKISQILERHGQNVAIDLEDSNCFHNLGMDLDLKYNWNNIKKVAIAWTCEIIPEMVNASGNNNALFMSRYGMCLLNMYFYILTLNRCF